MDVSIQYLSFFVIHSEGAGEQQNKRYRHFKTMDGEEYEYSELRRFLDGEFTRIIKRKAERHPPSESAPTKIGRFRVEPGYELDSNPNYNMIARCLEARDREQYHNGCDDLLRAYISTSSVRGGAFIVARAVLTQYFDEPFLFILKCDFEPKIARITDEDSLVGQVDMAISAKSMKSIQYPYMPEEGMLERGELKIHQASHARYFEEFLAYVSYEQSMPELVQNQVLGLVQEYMDQKYSGGQDGAGNYGAGRAKGGMNAAADYAAAYGAYGADEGMAQAAEIQSEGAEALHADVQRDWSGAVGLVEAGVSDDGAGMAESMSGAAGLDRPLPFETDQTEVLDPLLQARQQEEHAYEVWAASEKRDLQERWEHQTVVDAVQRIVEVQPDLQMKFNIDDTFVKAKLADYGSRVHFARIGERYVVLLEGDSFSFDKDFSPVELLYPEDIETVVERVLKANKQSDITGQD